MLFQYSSHLNIHTSVYLIKEIKIHQTHVLHDFNFDLKEIKYMFFEFLNSFSPYFKSKKPYQEDI